MIEAMGDVVDSLYKKAELLKWFLFVFLNPPPHTETPSPPSNNNLKKPHHHHYPLNSHKHVIYSPILFVQYKYTHKQHVKRNQNPVEKKNTLQNPLPPYPSTKKSFNNPLNKEKDKTR